MATRRRVVVTALACGMVITTMASAVLAAEGEATFGSQWWTQSVPDAKYQEFGEVPRGGLLQSFLLSEWWGPYSFDLRGTAALQAHQATRLTWTNGAIWRVDLGYTQTPHTFSQVARWAWAQNGPGTFTLPDTLQERNQVDPGSFTPRMADVLGNAAPIGLGFNTNVSTAQVRARPARGWQFEARGSTRNRSGLKPYAMAFGSGTVLENPEPIHQRMVDGDFTASYQRDRLVLQANGGISLFENEIGALRVDNPRRLTDQVGGDGAAVGVLDLYPDNRLLRGSLAMTYILPEGTAIAGTFGVAWGTQNDDFLPPTNNQALPQSNPDSLPAPSLDGKALQRNADVRLTTNPVQGLVGALKFRYTDYENQTRMLNFIGQAPDEASWQRFIELENRRYNHQQWTAGLDVDWTLTWQVKFGAIGEYRVRERTRREVEKDRETVLGGRARLRPVDGLLIAGQYTRGDRQGDAFRAEHYLGLTEGSTAGLFDSRGFVERPELRRFDVADRVQHKATADVSYLFGERFDASATYVFLRNDFRSDATFGLQEERVHLASSSATVHVNDRLDVNGGYGFGLTQTAQLSPVSTQAATFRADSNWTANLRDEEVFVFAGFDWAPTAKLGVTGNYRFSRNLAEFDLDSPLRNMEAPPSTLHRRHDVLADVRWRWMEKTTVIGRWGWEEYDVSDWATNDVPLISPASGASNAILLGDISRSYTAHRLALMLRHTF